MHLILFLLMFCSLGLGQALSTQHNTVSFHPDDEAYIEALLCEECSALEPFVSQGLEITATNTQGLAFAVRRNTFLPSADLVLEARYNVFNLQGNFLESTDWGEILEKPYTLFSIDSDFTVRVEYRLIITGQELAGTYQTTLMYHLGSATVRHEISVYIPSVTLLRLGGQVTSDLISVNFDYQGPSAIDYVRAIQNSTPLPLTGSNLETVEVFSNDPKGYTLTLYLHEVNNPNPLDLRLFNKSIDGQILQNSGPTEGFETLIGAENFSLFVDGSEDPGEYRFILEYQVVSNP